MTIATDLVMKFECDGVIVLPAVFSPAEVAEICDQLDVAFAHADGGILRTAKAIYGVRNLLEIWPGAATVWRKPDVIAFVESVLGPGAGLVRALYFDKPPEQTWTLPFHRDKTIAVRDNRQLPEGFAHPTMKAGVPHVEAPVWLLERMLTLRIHLDPMTDDNGPVSFIPRSHRSGDLGDSAAITPLGPAGDVLAMRPLISHGSRHTTPGATLRRRIVHLEFAAMSELPTGLAWHDFIGVSQPERES